MRWGWLDTPKERLVTASRVFLDLSCQILLLFFIYIMVFRRIQAALDLYVKDPDPLLQFLLNLFCGDYFCVLDWFHTFDRFLGIARFSLTVLICMTVLLLTWHTIRFGYRMARGMIFIYIGAFRLVLRSLGKVLPTISMPRPTFPTFMSEAMMPGSPFIDLRPAKGTFAFKQGSRVVGHGCRIGMRLVAPLHVTSHDNLVMVDGNGREHACPEFEYLASDVGYVNMPLAFGTPDTKVGPLVKGVASIAGTERFSGSVGTIEPYGFEASRYDGSTRPGMSGSLYTVGGQAIAMHLGGTPTANVGMSLMYIKMLLSELDYKPESSDLALLRKAMGGKKKKLMFRLTGDPDLVEVLYNGRYYRVDRSYVEAEEDAEYEAQMEERMFGTGSDAKYMRESAETDTDDDEVADQPAEDPVPEYSGNGICPAGQSSSRAAVIPAYTPENGGGTSTTSQKATTVLVGPKEASKKSSAPSKSTQPSAKARQRTRTRQRLMNLKLSLADLYRSIESGTIPLTSLETELRGMLNSAQQSQA